MDSDCYIFVKSLSSNTYLIGPAEISWVVLEKIIRPRSSRRRESSKYGYDSLCHSSESNRCAQQARKQEKAKSVEEERGRRDAFIPSVMKDKRHNIKTFGRPSFIVSLLGASADCVCEKGVIWFSVPCPVAKARDDQAICSTDLPASLKLSALKY